MPPKKKKVTGLIKLQIQAGAANPAPPVGPALGQHGVNIMEFCKAYNAATESQRGMVVPVEITVYEDRSFTFITKTPPAAKMILKAAGVEKGSGEPHKTKVAKITRAGPRDRHDQDARPQRQRPGRRREDHRRHRPFHGHHGRGLSSSPCSSAAVAGPALVRTTTPRATTGAVVKRSKTLRAADAKIDRRASYAPLEAVRLAKETSTTKFDGTVEVAFRLGVDPRKADQMVRGTVNLPHGTGKTARVLVFATGDRAEAARAAGADIVGSDELIDEVAKGRLDFDAVVATPDLMGKVGRLGRVLGPRGLMPNPKTGTVTPDVAKAVTEIKGGKIEFRVDKHSNLHFIIGKASFDETKLVENYAAALEEILRLKPSAAKGRYIKKATLTHHDGPRHPARPDRTKVTAPRGGRRPRPELQPRVE